MHPNGVGIHPFYAYPPTYLHLPTITGRSTEAAFLTGRYVRIRRKLMLITVIVPTTLFVSVSETSNTGVRPARMNVECAVVRLPWSSRTPPYHHKQMHKTHAAGHAGRRGPVAAPHHEWLPYLRSHLRPPPHHHVPVRTYIHTPYAYTKSDQTKRTKSYSTTHTHAHHKNSAVGLLDALIFGGAFDSCLDRATDERDTTSQLHYKQQASSQGERSGSFHLPQQQQQQPQPAAASPSHDESGGTGGIALQPLPPPAQPRDAARRDRDDSSLQSGDYPEASPSLRPHVHVGAQPYGAASGIMHHHSFHGHLHNSNSGLPAPPAMAVDAVSELTDPGLLAPMPGSVVAAVAGGGAGAVAGQGVVKGRVKIFATTYNGAWVGGFV